jgi:site-specific DNA-methyltransferase (adenine-specific)
VLIQGDCREALRQFGDGIFDVCIADPPYGDTSLEWDRQCAGWLPEVARVLKPACSLWVFGSMRFLAPLFAETAALGFKYSQDIVWEKQNGTGFHNDRFRRVHEHAVLFYRGSWSEVYHSPQFTNDATKKTARRKTRPTHTGHIERGHYVNQDGGPRLCRSVLQIRNEHGQAVHPTQKPVELVELLLRYSCPPAGFVLDPFGGSGTAGVAATDLGFRFAVCELQEEYVKIAEARIAKALEERLW